MLANIIQGLTYLLHNLHTNYRIVHQRKVFIEMFSSSTGWW